MPRFIYYGNMYYDRGSEKIPMAIGVTLPNSLVNLTCGPVKKAIGILWNIITNVCFPDLPKVTIYYYEIIAVVSFPNNSQARNLWHVWGMMIIWNHLSKLETDDFSFLGWYLEIERKKSGDRATKVGFWIINTSCFLAKPEIQLTKVGSPTKLGNVYPK